MSKIKKFPYIMSIVVYCIAWVFILDSYVYKQFSFEEKVLIYLKATLIFIILQILFYKIYSYFKNKPKS